MKYQIKYNKSGDIFIQEIEATSEMEARYIFYMEDMHRDILELYEVEE